MNKAVPAWPVIGLSFDGDTAIADPAGVGDPIRVSAYPDLATAAASAAVAAARRLEVPRCRVQGISPEGEVWMMVVDVDAETLEDLDLAPAPSKGGRGRSLGRLSTVPQRWWLVIGTAVIAAVAVGVVLLPREALPEPGSSAEPSVNEAPTPGAGQLPVSAPAGWDTYAGWVVDAAKPGAAAVMAGTDTLVVVDGGDVIAVDAETGQLRWRSSTSGDVTALFAPADEDVIYAGRGNTGVSVIDALTGDVITNGETAAREITLGDTPFAELPGQAGAVLAGSSWERRQVPATAVPIGAVGDGLVSVSVEQRRLWVTTSDDPVLPDAVQLEPPVDGLSLSRTVAFVDGQLILEWADQFGPRMFTIDTVTAEGRTDRRGTFETTGRSSGQVSVDHVNGLVGIGSLLLDVTTRTVSESDRGTVTARAGYGWSQQAGSGRVRISPDGATLPLAPGAPIPDVILPDGRAVVRAAQGSDGNAYYVLEAQRPTPTATPKPSPTDGEGQ